MLPKASTVVGRDRQSRSKEEDLFEALRALRKQLADQEALPAYIVLSDKVLHLLCLSRPTTDAIFR